MYAIIKTGGKQYRVGSGDVVRVEKLDGAVGDSITLEDVLLVRDKERIIADPKALATAKVHARVTGQGRQRKIVVFKKKRRKGYRRTIGHRQYYTELAIEKIELA